MIAGLRHWWIALSPRERVLLGVAAALTCAVLAWLIARPLYAAWTDLDSRHRAAVERQARVAAKIAILKDVPRSGGAAVAATGPIDAWLRASALERGLTLDRVDARGDAVATIAIGAARAPVITDWLAALEEQGFVVDQLTMAPAANGAVAVSADLRRRNR